MAALIRERFTRPVLVAAVVLVAVANTFNIGADIGSMAAAAGLLVPVALEHLWRAFTRARGQLTG